MTEVAAGVHRFEEVDGARRLCSYVVAGAERLLVVDAGLPTTPERGLLALLRELGAERLPVTAVVTHPDADHRGGLPALRAALPRLEIVAHTADAPLVADPERTLAERYRAFEASDGMGPPPERFAALRERLGRPVEVDRTLDADTILDLGAGRRAELLHVPGHSPGHLAVWLPAERVALAGDAVMGAGIRRLDGSLLFPPMFAPPAAYYGTIERLERLEPSLLLLGHEPPLADGEAARFLADSRGEAERIEALVAAARAAGAETLGEVCAEVARDLGVAPHDLAVTVAGFLA